MSLFWVIVPDWISNWSRLNVVLISWSSVDGSFPIKHSHDNSIVGRSGWARKLQTQPGISIYFHITGVPCRLLPRCIGSFQVSFLTPAAMKYKCCSQKRRREFHSSSFLKYIYYILQIQNNWLSVSSYGFSQHTLTNDVESRFLFYKLCEIPLFPFHLVRFDHPTLEA